MDIQLTGVLVSKTGDFINDYQEFDIQGGQEGLNSILAEELEPDTLYWIKGIFVMNGVEYESKAAQFKTNPVDHRFRLVNMSNNSNTIRLIKNYSAGAITLQYSKDGENWSTWDSTSGNFSITLQGGEMVFLKGNNSTISSVGNDFWYFSSTDDFSAVGNIMLMIDESGTSDTVPAGCFNDLFRDCTHLLTPPELPATTLGRACYEFMFLGCTSLTSAPELPATVLSEACYLSMFNGCHSLMQAPELPATTLTPSCYSEMFLSCSSLTKAPELPAASMAQDCYYRMFVGCSNMTEITVYATSWSNSNAISWVDGVAATGDFMNLGGATIHTGVNGIPSGWTEHTSI